MAGELRIPRYGSCRASDWDYDPWLVRISRRIAVRVNGRLVPHVIAYDRDEGWVRALKQAPTGPAFAVRRGVVAEHTRIGRVTVHWR